MLRVKFSMFERFLIRLHWILWILSSKIFDAVLRKHNKNGYYNLFNWDPKNPGEIILKYEEEEET